MEGINKMIKFLSFILKLFLFCGFSLCMITAFYISLAHDQVIIGLIFLSASFILFWLLLNFDEISGCNLPRRW